MVSPIRIAVDLMGGDFGLHASLPAAVQSLFQFADLSVVLVGNQTAIEQQLTLFPATIRSDRITVIHAADVVDMSDKPSVALRQKEQSSMRLALDLLQKGRVDAVVSAGNTGALMTMGHYVLKTLPGIDRPAICAPLPTVDGRSYLLDLGANVDSSAQQLYQFAIMGSALCSAVDGIDKPRVALLNIGQEEIKGNEQVQLAHKLFLAEAQSHTLSSLRLDYVGFVEGDDLFKAQADVIVCDGFVGNVALKTCEGVAWHIAKLIKETFSAHFFSRIVARLASPMLKKIYQTLNHEQYNGASFLGLQGIVIKSHGHSGSEGFQQAITEAYLAVKHNVLASINDAVSMIGKIERGS